MVWRMQGHMQLLEMAANKVGRSEFVPKPPRISSVHSERADLRQRLESSFPLDALLRTLHEENVLTDYELEQLFPIPQLQCTLVDRNRKFLDYLANKDPTAVSDTLSILLRPEYEPYGYFGEMLRQLFGVEEKEGEGMRGKTSRKPQHGGEHGSDAKETPSIPAGALGPPPLWSAAAILEGEGLAGTTRDKASGEPGRGTTPEVGPNASVVDALPSGKGGLGSSSTSKQEPLVEGQSTADDPPLTPLPKVKTASSSVGAAQRGRVVPPHAPTTPNCADQSTSSHPMTPWNRNALVSLQDDLKLRVLMEVGLGDKLEKAAGGFMNQFEARTVREQPGNIKQIDKVIEILLGKADEDFTTFLRVLRDTNNGVWAEELVKTAEQFKREGEAHVVRDKERARTCATQLEAVQSGCGSATGEGIEAELRLGKPEGEGLAGITRDKASGEPGRGTTLEVDPNTSVVDALPSGKGGLGSFSTSKQEPVEVGQSTADGPPLATLPKDKTASSSVGAAQRGRVVPPHVPTTPNSEDQPTSYEPLKPVSGDPSLKGSDTLAQTVPGRSGHLVLLRRYVSRQAWGKGRALLEALGLTRAQIAQCYGMHPLNEEESVQDGLQAWIEGGRNTTWGDLLRAMETAGIAIQQRDGLKEELCSNTAILEGEGLAGTTRDESLRAKLGPYYKGCIQDNPLLASSTMQHVRLNLVQPEQRQPVAGRVDKEVAVHLARGGVEQVPHEKVPLHYEDILSFSPPVGISRQRVLIEGVPGSGKSTLVQRMCHDWSAGRFAQDYKVVVQVTLRSLPKDQKLSLEDLIFTSVGNEDKVKEVTDFVTTCEGQEVLFMFDGFDELSEEMRENSLVCDIINGYILPQSSFVVTTRPISAESLYHCVDRRVEISGFREEEVEEYITEYFASSNPSAGSQLWSTLSLRPHIKRLCYVPLLLLMICYIVSLGGDSAELPRTLHELFELLIILTVNHNLERAGRKERAGSLQDVRRHCPSFAKLAQLALDGIEKDTIIFPNLDFDVDPALLGFFNRITTRNRFGLISHSSHFLHLTLQEFMAALAVAKKTPEEQVTFWKRHLTLRYNKEGDFVLAPDRYHRLFLFYSGESGLSTPGIQSMLLDTLNTVVKPSISRRTPLPELCEVIAESGNAQLARSILSPCGPTVVIDRDCVNDVSVAWCVGEYCKQVDGAGIRIEAFQRYGGVTNFISQLGDVSTLVRVEVPYLYSDDRPTVRQFLLKQTQLKCVMFGDLKNTEDVIDPVKDVLTHHKESLEEVALHGESVKETVLLDPLVDSLVACQRLTSLELRRVTLSLQSLLAVVKGLHNLSALGLVWVSLLDERPLTASDVHLIASSVEHHPSLRELTVEGECSESLVEGAVEGMARRHGVEKLAVTPYSRASTDAPIDRALVPPICAVMRTGSLKTLCIGRLSEPDQVVQVLEELQHCTQLRELELHLSDEVVPLPSAVEAGLSKCTTLQKLTVERSHPSVTAALLKAVTVNRSLEEVSLNECDFDGVSHLTGTDFNHLRKVEMSEFYILLPSIIAAICCSSSLEELVVTPSVSELVERTEDEEWEEVLTGEDVLDRGVLKEVEEAITVSTSVKRIEINGACLRWTNVATAILKGAAHNTVLRELELTTPWDFPLSQEVIDDVRRANPKLRLVVSAGWYDICLYSEIGICRPDYL